MDKIVDLLIGSFDFGYMFSVNVLTYIVIKVIDALNGDKVVPAWLKRTIAVICGLIIGTVIVTYNGYTNILLYSFILSLVSWDTLFKPILIRLKGTYYKRNQS